MSDERVQRKGRHTQVRRRSVAAAPIVMRQRLQRVVHVDPLKSPILKVEWRDDPTKKYKLDAKGGFGCTVAMKEALREAARRLSIREGRRVSMAEVNRRLLAAAGIR